jgi:hypothetical protein
MIKKQYQKEIQISGPLSRGSSANNKGVVLKVQSWLNLFARVHPASGTSTGIDSDYGPATELAVKNFQKLKKIPETGKVDKALFALLCASMTTAFEKPLKGQGLRALVLAAANQHLAAGAFELTIKNESNSGPWVRAYMDGNEGEPWFWCMGFVQSMIDQAASSMGKDFRTLMPLTYSCDIVAAHGIQRGILHRSADIRKDPGIVKPGDIFLMQKAANDWFHTGLVVSVQGDVFETIEGNTNEAGSHNGVAVMKRTRNFRSAKIDTFSIEPLAK